MKPIVVSADVAVGEFPTVEEIAILAKAGFRSIINNQPDGEVERFPADHEIAAIAARDGLEHAYAPLSSRSPNETELLRHAQAIATLPGPIYAFCYSGSRSAAACALVATATMEVDSIIQRFAEAGFDLEGLRGWLLEARQRHVGAASAAAGSADQVGIVVHPRAAGFNGFAV